MKKYERYQKTISIFVLIILLFSLYTPINGKAYAETFIQPRDVAFDSSGNMYVLDGNRVKKVDPTGTLLMQFGSVGTGDGQFKDVIGLDVDSNGNIYVLDRVNKNLQKFDSSGTFVYKKDLSMYSNPIAITLGGIAIDSNNNVYVGDSGAIYKFNSAGTQIATWTGPSNAARIAIDSSDNIYMVDGGNSTLYKYTTAGTKVNEVYSADIGPDGVAVDSNGNVYTINALGNKFSKFDSNLNLIKRYPLQSSLWPRNNALEVRGTTLYYMQMDNNSIIPSISIETVAPTVSSIVPSDASTGVAKNSAITVTFSEDVSVKDASLITLTKGASSVPFTPSVVGNVLTLTPSSDLDYSSTYTVTVGANSVTDNAANNLAVSTSASFTTEAAPDSTPPTVSSVEPSDLATGIALSSAITVTFSENVQINDPALITLTKGANAVPFTYNIVDNVLTLTPSSNLDNGSTYTVTVGANSVKDSANNNIAASTSTSFTTVSALSSLIQPRDVAFDVSGNIYVLDGNRVKKFDPAGNLLLQFGSVGTGNGQFKDVIGLDVDKNGNIYVLDRVNKNLQKFDSSGTFVYKKDLSMYSNPIAITLGGIAIDSNNNVYVGDSGAIYKFNSAGTQIATWTGPSNAARIAIDSSDNIYMVDGGNSTLYKYTTAGTKVNEVYSADIGPDGVAVDSNGNVYTINALGNKFSKFDSNLNLIKRYPLQSSLWPRNNALEVSGTTLYYMQMDNNSIIPSITIDIGVADTTAPTVSGIAPSNLQTNVAKTSAITVTFSENVQINDATLITLTKGASSVPFTHSIVGNVLTLTPSSNLDYSSTYAVTVGANSVKDSANNNVAQGTSTSFTTEPMPDTTAPTVSSIAPSDLQTNVANTSAITVTFSENVQINDAALITLTKGASSVPFTHSIVGNVLTLTPSSNLDYSSTYTVTVGANSVKDSANNNIAQGTSTSFTTEAMPDTTPPTVSSIVPNNLATNVAKTSVITVTFSENVQLNNANLITLTKGVSSVPFTTSIEENILTITPNSNLDYNSTYTITVGANAVKDMANNTIAQSTIIGFKTASALSSLVTPIDVAFDISGNIYVLDGNRVKKFDTSGNLLLQFGSVGTGNGQFNDVTGIEVDKSGNIYVLDRVNKNLQKFDSSGTFIYKTDLSSYSNPAVVNLAGIALDSNNNIYISDPGHVYKFNSSGNRVATWTVGVDGTRIAIDRFDNVYLSDGGNNTLYKYTTSGNEVKQVFGFDIGPHGVGVDANGNVYTVNYLANKIVKFNSDLNVITSYSIPSLWPKPHTLEINGSTLYYPRRASSATIDTLTIDVGSPVVTPTPIVVSLGISSAAPAPAAPAVAQPIIAFIEQTSLVPSTPIAPQTSAAIAQAPIATVQAAVAQPIEVKQLTSDATNAIIEKAYSAKTTDVSKIDSRFIQLDSTDKKVATSSAPIAVTIKVENLKLTEQEIANLTGIRYEISTNGGVQPVKLGGSYNKQNKTFTFYTDKTGTFGVGLSDKLTTIELKVGDVMAKVNNVSKKNDVAPNIINDRVMIPIRFIAETLGAKVSWDDKSRKITVSKDDKTIEMTVGKVIEGMGVAPVIQNGRTLVPTRYVAEQLNSQVLWIEEQRNVYIIK